MTIKYIDCLLIHPPFNLNFCEKIISTMTLGLFALVDYFQIKGFHKKLFILNIRKN